MCYSNDWGSFICIWPPVNDYNWSKYFVWFSQRDFCCQRHWRWRVCNRCYPLTSENMAEGPDVWTTSRPWDELMWQWWRCTLAEETDLVASKVPIFPAFSVLVFTPKLGNPGRQGKMEEEKYVNTVERERPWEDWSVALMVVTDVEFSTKLCQKPSCQS